MRLLLRTFQCFLYDCFPHWLVSKWLSTNIIISLAEDRLFSLSFTISSFLTWCFFTWFGSCIMKLAIRMSSWKVCCCSWVIILFNFETLNVRLKPGRIGHAQSDWPGPSPDNLSITIKLTDLSCWRKRSCRHFTSHFISKSIYLKISCYGKKVCDNLV